MKKLFFLLVFIMAFSGLFSQEKIEFISTDGLTITADLYKISDQASYILLFHQARSSRGEYKEIAPRLNKLGFNCIAIDQRSGDEMNFVSNETAQRAKDKGLPVSYLQAEKDMLAAIEYAFNLSKKPVILFGSSYSASLAIKIAVNNPKVKAVVVFSPGEYLTTEGVILKNIMPAFDKPVFAAAPVNEFDVVNDLFLTTKSVDKVLFRPQEGGVHGAKALWKESEHNKECWLELTMFLTKFK